MKILLTKEQTNFIVQTFGCKVSGNNESTYFQTMAFIQTVEDAGTCIFEMKNISKLPKEDFVDIILYINYCL